MWRKEGKERRQEKKGGRERGIGAMDCCGISSSCLPSSLIFLFSFFFIFTHDELPCFVVLCQCLEFFFCLFFSPVLFLLFCFFSIFYIYIFFMWWMLTLFFLIFLSSFISLVFFVFDLFIFYFFRVMNVNVIFLPLFSSSVLILLNFFKLLLYFFFVWWMLILFFFCLFFLHIYLFRFLSSFVFFSPSCVECWCFFLCSLFLSLFIPCSFLSVSPV